MISDQTSINCFNGFFFMNIHLNLSSIPLSFFKESISISFLQQHIKIMTVVGLALGSLAAYYAISRGYCFKAKDLSVEEKSEDEQDPSIDVKASPILGDKTIHGKNRSETFVDKGLEEQEDAADQSYHLTDVYNNSSQKNSSTPSKMLEKLPHHVFNSNPLRERKYPPRDQTPYHQQGKCESLSPDDLTPYVSTRKKTRTSINFSESLSENLQLGDLSPVHSTFSPNQVDFGDIDLLTPVSVKKKYTWSKSEAKKIVNPTFS